MAKRPDKKIHSEPKSWFTQDRKIAALLAFVAFVLYARTIGFAYALDDIAVLQENKFVHDGFGGFGKILTTFYWHGFESFANQNSGIFRPVSLLLFATEWQFFGDSPVIFHFVHVLLYAICAFQLFLLLNSLFGKDKRSIVFATVLLWVVFPVHTEVVANLKSADEILALMFSLLGFRQLLNWNESNQLQALLGSSGFFFLAVLSKEGAVLMLPIAIFMLMLFKNRSINEVMRPALVLLGTSVLWVAWHQGVILSSEALRVSYDYRHNALLTNDSWIDQRATAIGMQSLYWWKSLVGYPLSYNYSFNQIPIVGVSGINFWIALAGLVASIFAVFRFFRAHPILVFGIIFYWISFALTCNIFFNIGDIFAERFLFVPSIGFALIVAWLMDRVLNKSEAVILFNSSTKAIVALSIVYSGLTYNRSGDWKDQTTLFLADVEHAPNSARVHSNAGLIYLNSALAEKNEFERTQAWKQAYSEFKKAVGIDPNDFQAMQALGQVCYHQKDYKASVEWSKKSLQARKSLDAKVKEDPGTLYNLGDAYRKLEMYDSAVAVYNRALLIMPACDSYIKVGDMHLLAKDTAAALVTIEASVKLDSMHVASWDKLANLKGMRGDYVGSTEAFLHLSRIDSSALKPWQMIYTNSSLMGDSLMMKRASEEYAKRGGK